MKKRIVAVLFLAALFVAKLPLTQDSFAAYAYQWTVGGEQFGPGGSNSAGTASWQKDNTSNDGGVLTLNNYHGGQIKIECLGTELGHTFNINLVGDNYITVDKGIGILALEPITFSGNGTLTIEAAIPISANDYIIDGQAGRKIEGNYSFGENKKIVIKTSGAATSSNNDNSNPAANTSNNTATNPNNDSGSSVVDTDNENNQLPNGNSENIDSETGSDVATNEKDAIDWKLIAVVMITVASISIIVIIALLVLLAKKGKAQATDGSKDISDMNTNPSSQH